MDYDVCERLVKGWVNLKSNVPKGPTKLKGNRIHMTGNLILDIYDDVDDGGGGNQIVEEFTLDEPSGAENGDLFKLKALLCLLAIRIV